MPRKPRMYLRALMLSALLVVGQLACAPTPAATPAAGPTTSADPAAFASPSTAPSGATAPLFSPQIPGGPQVPTPVLGPLEGRFEIAGHTGGEIGSVAVQSHYAYLAVGARLAVLDVADPAQPRLLGEAVAGTARLDRLVVAGNLACAADVAGVLHMIDVADPARPRVAGAYTAPSPVQELALAGGYLYLTSDAGLYIVDVRDGAQPKQVAFYDTPGQALQLLVGGNLAFVTVGAYSGYPYRELRILDVANPAQPKEVAVYNRQPGTNTWPTAAVGLQAHYAYVAAEGSELRVLDVANPARPVQVGSYPTGGQAHALACGDGHLSLSVDGGLLLFDVTDPARPRQVLQAPLPGQGTLMAAGGDLAYAVERQPGGYDLGTGSFASVLHIARVAGPQAPAEVGRYDAVSPVAWSLDGQAVRLAAVGSRLYVAADRAGLRILDVADAAQPRLLGWGGMPGFFYDVALAQPDAAGRVYAFAADSSLVPAARPGLRVFDVTDPAKIAQVGFYDSPGNAMGVAIAGHTAYLADGTEGLRIVDIADPAHPREIGASEVVGFARAVAVAGHYAYVADAAAGLRIVDVADPAHPREVTVYEDGDHALAVTLAGDLAYVTTATGVIMVSLADAAQPVAAGRLPVPPRCQVAVSGTLACVADEQALRAYDIADPAQPREIARLDLHGTGGVPAVAMAGTEVYLSTSLGGVWTLRLR